MKKSFYYALKPEHRNELNQRLIDSGWADYDGHLIWLKSIGCDIVKSGLTKYGANHRTAFEERQSTDEYRRACGDELSDEIELNAKNLTATAQRASQYLADVIERQMQQLSENSEASPYEVLQAANTLNKLVSSIGTLNTSFVIQRKMADEIKAKIEAKLDSIGGDEKSGITQEFMDEMKSILRI